MHREAGKKRIGVLDVQGSVIEHVQILEKLGVEVVRVKNPKDLEKVNGLIIPGGESTTVGKLLRRFGLREKIISKVRDGLAVYGTCAGAILLAKNLVGQQSDTMKLMDIEVERNAYGRQLDSFDTEVEFNFGDKTEKIPAVFIRAPKINKTGKDVEILAKFKNEIAAARQGNLLITTFHPELTEDTRVHQYFIKIC
ncbi:pyridoxal 5'-phosphate synthase glutaminase subunit PdxT [Patescibacteria group bacterium]